MKQTIPLQEESPPHSPAPRPQGIPDTLFQDDRAIRRLLWTLIATLLITYVLVCAGKFFDEDEFQTMVLVVNMAEGKRLYADMWDNHGPVLTHVLSFLYSHFGWPTHSVMLLGRGLSLAILPLTLFFYFRLLRELEPRPSFFPLLACFLLLFSNVFTQISVEVRPDIPMNLAWVMSLFFWFRARNTGSNGIYFLGGLAIGCAFWFSFKTLVLGAAVGLMFLVDMLLERRILWRPVLAYGLGAAIPPLAMLAVLHHAGLYDAFIHNYILQNTDRTPESPFMGLGKLLAWDPLYTPILVISLILGAGKVLRREPFPRELLLPLVCTWGLFLQYLFLLPTHNEQSVLPMIVTGSMVQAWFLLTVIPRLNPERWTRAGHTLRTTSTTAVLVTALLLWTALLTQWPAFKSLEKIRWADGLLQEIEPGALVLDGAGLPLFRPRILPYLSWVNTLRERLREGTLGIDLVSRMQEENLRYVIRDDRTATMGEAVNRFIDENFLPAKAPMLWVAGMRIPQNARRSHTIEIKISGLYHWALTGGAETLRINGRPPSNPVFLEKGAHGLEWEGEAELTLSTLEIGRLKEKENPATGVHSLLDGCVGSGETAASSACPRPPA